MRILIINGPNLNLLGKREPGIYGNVSFEEFLSSLKTEFPQTEIQYFQSNVEGELINKLHDAGMKNLPNVADGIIFNPGGYSHTSVALADAVSAIETEVVEVHISNVHAREDFRQTLITARTASGVISGFGLDSYRMALTHFIKKKS